MIPLAGWDDEVWPTGTVPVPPPAGRLAVSLPDSLKHISNLISDMDAPLVTAIVRGRPSRAGSHGRDLGSNEPQR